MKIVEVRAMRGPNYWSVKYSKLIVLKLILEEKECSPGNEFSLFTD